MPPNEKKPSLRPVRLHSFVTFADEKDIQDVICKHSSSIRAYAYIKHDKDVTSVHYHLIIRTYDAWSPIQINKWFDEVKRKKDVNTFNEPAGDLGALKTYITHSDLQSIEHEKHQYDFADVKDFGLFSEYTDRDSYDETYEIINSMLKKTPTRTLVRRYGKQFIYHYSQFSAVRDAIMNEDQYDRTYNAPDYAKPHVFDQTKLKPIPLDNIDIDDVLNNPITKKT